MNTSNIVNVKTPVVRRGLEAGTYKLTFLEVYFEKQRYDGWYNNRAYPDWGSVVYDDDTRFLRRLFFD
ncbi:hypothetical protein MSG28_010293 [Choristoneura fumiferana]|uniref:Uncharacterized protein n=1 Tax=Choristoneura fumiferana TaxID=7141 RepID=A0ACC0KKE5_CHOFU|nr:hypothetical protein MSG28_010293 [Choristoneura fumiferana]